MQVVRVIVAALFIVTILAGPAFAQGDNPISESIREQWRTAKRTLMGAAEAMPAAEYGFRPVDSVRTFGEIVAHVAGNNYFDCALAKGEESPYRADHFQETAKGKAEIVKALEGSHAYCDAVYNDLTDAAAAEVVQSYRNLQAPRASLFLGNNRHVHEHYGNLVTYMRTRGVVPPTSRRTR